MTTDPTAPPVILYDTTLRDGTQGENITLSLADKLRVARMLDEYGFPFIEGGWPGSNPKDIEFFAAARTTRWEQAKLAAFGSTRHRSNRARGRPEPPGAGQGRDAGRHDLRQVVAAPRDRGPGRHAGREPGHDRGLGRVHRRARPRGGVRRRALLRRLHGGPRLRAVDAPRRAPGRRPDARPVRHQRRHAHRRAGPDRGRRPRLARGRPRCAAGHLGHPHPQRRGARGRQLDRRGPGRHPPRPGDDQRLRRAVRQREHGLDPRQPRTQDAGAAHARRRRLAGRPHGAQPERRGDRERRAQRLPAVRRPVRVRAQGRRPRRGRGEGRAELPARRPDRPSATPAGSS